MRILVTGSAGFIGQHLCRELRESGHEVTGIDWADSRKNELDLSVPGTINRQLLLWQPEVVVHLAAQVGRIFGEVDMMWTVRSNATMCALVAKACGMHGIPVLYSSTSEVYGDQGGEVCDEDGPMVLPHNLYGLTKRWGEEVLRLYAPDGLKIARLSMPYGTGAPPGRGRRAMDTFLWQAYHRKEITVHRGAERSWCHVSDTVRGLRLILERGDPGAYNVGRDDDPVSMLHLAMKCCLLTEAPTSLINVIDPPHMQTVVKRLSTEKLRNLGWKPTIDLDEGLKELLLWVKEFPSD